MSKEIIFNRPEIKITPPAHHGAFDYAELEQLGLDPDNVLDFSVNSNPYGPSPHVRQAIANTPLDRYPDREAITLRRTLSERLNLPTDQIVVGNGASELLWLIAFAFLRHGDRVLVLGPTFGEYSRVSALMGAQVEIWQAQAEDFTVNAAGVAKRLREVRHQVVFLCNPNNPTGVALSPKTITAWANRQPSTLFVIDESYLNFAPSLHSILTVRTDNVLEVRSMTKDYALAGLRLGYAASHNQALISAVVSVRPAWNVSGLAQAAGITALQDEAYLQKCLAAIGQAKNDLVKGLANLDFPPLVSAVHYFLLQVNHAAAFRQTLLKQGILVRDCSSFGLPNFVRVAPRRPEQNRRLLAAVQAIKGRRGGEPIAWG